jgi:hypothetical protein
VRFFVDRNLTPETPNAISRTFESDDRNLSPVVVYTGVRPDAKPRLQSREPCQAELCVFAEELTHDALVS